MKTNVMQYLSDKMHKKHGALGVIVMMKMERIEKVKMINRNGFAIVVTDRRDRYKAKVHRTNSDLLA